MTFRLNSRSRNCALNFEWIFFFFRWRHTVVYDRKCSNVHWSVWFLRGPRSVSEMLSEFFPNLSLFPLLCEAVSCDCFQTSMPLKWNCGSTVFALDTRLVNVSDCYRAHLCLVWRFSTRTCFCATTFHPSVQLGVQTQLDPVWNMGSINFTHSFWHALYFLKKKKEKAPVPVDFLWFYSQLVCMTWTPKNTAWPICETNLLRLLLMGLF